MTDYNNLNVTNRGNKYDRRPRYKRRKNNSITPKLIFFFCLLAVVTTSVLKLGFNIRHKNSGGGERKEENVIELMAKGGQGIIDAIKDSDDLKELKDKDYPDSLVRLYKRNKEAREFVLNYESHMESDLDEEGYVEKPKSVNISEDMEKLEKGDIPLFLQWDERWGYSKYGDDFMALNGCGPTCLSMVYCGLTGHMKYNPYKLAKLADKRGYYVDGAGSSWNMMVDLAYEIGLDASNISADSEVISNYLSEGYPIICIMGPGDFTNSGHFIVLTGMDEDGKVKVNDPNSIENSQKSWDLEELVPQIKNLWVYRYWQEEYMEDDYSIYEDEFVEEFE